MTQNLNLRLRFARILPPCDLHSSQTLSPSATYFSSACFTHGEALHASIIHNDSGTLNCQPGRRRRHGANIAQSTQLSNADVVAASLDGESHRRTGTIPLTTVIGRRLNLLRKEIGRLTRTEDSLSDWRGIRRLSGGARKTFQ